MSSYIWTPTAERIAEANVTRLMASLGIAVDPHDPAATARSAREFVERSCRDVEWFWTHALQEMGMPWYTPYSRLLDRSRGNAWADWFIGGETNIALACVDRHAQGERADHRAFIAEGEDGTVRTFTFAELGAEVARLTNALRALGVQRGDRVACYAPM